MSKGSKSCLKHESLTAEEVPNVVHPDGDTYDCICPRPTRDLLVPERQQTCYRCSRDYHTNCLWPLEDTPAEYECPLCFLKHCLPDRKVAHILFGGYLRQTKKNKMESRINLALDPVIGQNYAIQARCVRLNRESRHELTWPENCTLYLNSKKLVQFRPLQASSSIKRRIDQEILFQKKVLGNRIDFLIQEKRQHMEGARKESYSPHFVIIAAVLPLRSTQVMQEFQMKHLNEDHSRFRLIEYMNRGGQDCVIEKIKVTLKCHYYMTKITVPVRSRHCRNHYEPFDLHGFVMANVSSKNSAQKWKCPICKKRAYDLEIDDYLLQIINNNTSLAEIYFNKLGQLEFEKNNEPVPLPLLSDKDQPSPNSSTTAEKNNHEDLKVEVKLQEGIKRENRSHPEQNPLIEIPILQQSSEKSKIVFHDCIEVIDDEEDVQTIGKPKRSYRARTNTYLINDMPARVPKKKHKKQTHKPLPPINQDLDSSSVRPLDSLEAAVFHSDQEEGHSRNTDEQFNSKPDRKKKPKRTYHRERVGIDEPERSISKASKTLVPSPLIRTVIPEAIRITESKLPEPRRTAPSQPIEILDSEEETAEVVRFRKLQYHLRDLEREKQWAMHHCDKTEISSSQETSFMHMCENFYMSVQRSELID